MADMLLDGPFDPRDWMSPEELAETAHLFKDSPMILTEDIETPEFLWSTGRQREMVDKYEELTSKLLPPLPEMTAEDHLNSILNEYENLLNFADNCYSWNGMVVSTVPYYPDVTRLQELIKSALEWRCRTQ